MGTTVFIWLLPFMFALFGVALWVLARRDPLLRWATHAGNGFCIAGIAMVIDLQRGLFLPNMYLWAVPLHWAVLVCVGHALLVRAGSALPWRQVAPLLAVGTALYCWFIFVQPSASARPIVVNAVGFGILSLTAIGLSRSHGALAQIMPQTLVQRAVNRANLVLISLTAASYVGRTMQFMASHQALEFASRPLWSQYMIWFYLTAAVTGFLTGLLLIVTLLLDIVDQHYRATATDPLTGIANRRSLDRMIADHDNGERRVGAVAVIDIDHFKAINDRHGHAAGDVVLIRTAALLRDHFTVMGDVARLGGEEFAVLIPASHADGAVAAVDLAMLGLSALRFDPPLDGVTLTASAGVASVAAGEPLADTLRRADGALYAAKQAGRNRVMSAEHGRGDAARLAGAAIAR
jgi:diguanylate cyclase (GGDEF)-like protein